MSSFRKQVPDAPEGFLETEAAGLRWLAASPGGARVVSVFSVNAKELILERITTAEPSAKDAYKFGAALARTHRAGAPAFGAGPPDARFRSYGFFGPADYPLKLSFQQHEQWNAYFYENLVLPYAQQAAAKGVIHNVSVYCHLKQILQCCSGLGSPVPCTSPFCHRGEPVSRIHGDLWSGNLLWSKNDKGGTTGTLIDPAAHGGCGLTDLALLQLFGVPYFEAILAGYRTESPLPDTTGKNWRMLLDLHQLPCILVHAIVFGDWYGSHADVITKRIINYAREEDHRE